jgi:transglutaminase-like putative cysteine protease
MRRSKRYYALPISTTRYGVSTASTTMFRHAGAWRRRKAVIFRMWASASCARRFRRAWYGYLYGLKPMDLHAWFEAFVDAVHLDATQTLCGRIVLGYGRDAADVAFISTMAVPLQLDDMQVEAMAVDTMAHETPKTPTTSLSR